MRIISRCKTVYNNEVTVEIGKKDDPQTLTLDMSADEPVVLSQSGNAQDVYEPYRLGTASIRLAFTHDSMLKAALEWLGNLTYNEAPVVIKFRDWRGMCTVFAGYVNPNIRQADYSTSVTILEVNAYDVLSSLQYVPVEVESGTVNMYDLFVNGLGSEADETYCRCAYIDSVMPYPTDMVFSISALKKDSGSSVSMLDVLTETAKITGLTWLQVPQGVLRFDDGPVDCPMIVLTDMAISHTDVEFYHYICADNSARLQVTEDIISQPVTVKHALVLDGHSRGTGDRLSIYTPYTEVEMDIQRKGSEDKYEDGDTIDLADCELISFKGLDSVKCEILGVGGPSLMNDSSVQADVVNNKTLVTWNDTGSYIQWKPSAEIVDNIRYGDDTMSVYKLQSTQTASSVANWGYGEGSQEYVFAGEIWARRVDICDTLYESSARPEMQKNSGQSKWINETVVTSTSVNSQGYATDVLWGEKTLETAAFVRIGSSLYPHTTPECDAQMKSYLMLTAGCRDLKAASIATTATDMTTWTYSNGWTYYGGKWHDPDSYSDPASFPVAAQPFRRWFNWYTNKKLMTLANNNFREEPIWVKLTDTSRLVLKMSVTWPQLGDPANLPALKGNLSFPEYRTMDTGIVPLRVPFMMTVQVGEYYIGQSSLVGVANWRSVTELRLAPLKFSVQPLCYFPDLDFMRDLTESARSKNQTGPARGMTNKVNMFDRIASGGKGLEMVFSKITIMGGSETLLERFGGMLAIRKGSVKVTFYGPFPLNDMNSSTNPDLQYDGLGSSNFAWCPKKVYISDFELSLTCSEADKDKIGAGGKNAGKDVIYKYQGKPTRLTAVQSVHKDEMALTLLPGYVNTVTNYAGVSHDVVQFKKKDGNWLQLPVEELRSWKYAKTYMQKALESITKTFDYKLSMSLMHLYWAKVSQNTAPSEEHHIGQEYVDIPEDIHLSTTARTIKAGRYWQTSMFRSPFELYYTRTSSGVWFQKYDADIQHYTGLIWDGADIWQIIYIRYTEGHWQAYCAKSGGNTDIDILSPVDEVLHMGGVFVYESDDGQRLYFSGEGYAQQHKELGLYIDSNDSRVPYELVFSTKYEYGKYEGESVTVLREVQSSTDLKREAVNAELVLVDQIYEDVISHDGKYVQK